MTKLILKFCIEYERRLKRKKRSGFNFIKKSMDRKDYIKNYLHTLTKLCLIYKTNFPHQNLKTSYKTLIYPKHDL